jgi:uncharacterized membrane protein YfhO
MIKDTQMDSFPQTLSFYRGFGDIMGSFAAFSPQTSHLNLPGLYCGMLCVMFIGMFLGHDMITFEEKAVFIITAGFLIVACNLNVLDFIFNAFRRPVGTYQRYTFLIAFLTVSAAYHSFTRLDSLKLIDLLYMGMAASFVLYMAYGGSPAVYVISNAALCGIYLIIIAFIAFFKNRIFPKVVFCLLLLTTVAAEAGYTSYEFVNSHLAGQMDEYPDKYSNVKQLLEKRNSKDMFYRTEFTNNSASADKSNDTSLYGYNGISVFSSTSDKNMNTFINALGLPGAAAKDSYAISYAETSPLTAEFLNLKYLIDRDGSPVDGEVFWNKTQELEGSFLLENRYYLPFGFMVNKETANYAPYGKSPFAAQNELFSSATGLQGDLFTILPFAAENHINYTVSPTAADTYTYSLNKGHGTGSFVLQYRCPADGMLYAYHKNNAYFGGAANISLTTVIGISKNGETKRTLVSPMPYIFTAGYFKEGDIITFTLDMLVLNSHLGAANYAVENGSMFFQVGFLNKELFEKGYAFLSEQTLTLTKFTDMRIKGEINVKTEGLLYVSIPFENRFKAYVDGIKTEIIPIGGAMAGVYLDEGSHDIEFRYYNDSLLIGICISVIAVCAFVSVIYISGRPHPPQRPGTGGF